MPLRPEGLALFVCPVCRHLLALDAAANIVYCSSCGRRYPIIDGILVLLADRASYIIPSHYARVTLSARNLIPLREPSDNQTAYFPMTPK
jgi:LSD1 subclass zinc finger protein